MKTKFVAVLICLVNVALLACSSANAAVNGRPDLNELVAYTNTFETVDSLLTELLRTHLIDRDENAAVLEILRTEKIDTATKLTRAVIEKKSLRFGTLTFTITSPEVYKTRSGLILNLGKQKSFDATFASILHTLSSEKSASAISLLINKAEAQNNTRADQVAAALNCATGQTFANLNIDPAHSDDILHSLTGLRSFIQTGSVTCTNGNSIIHMSNTANPETRVPRLKRLSPKSQSAEPVPPTDTSAADPESKIPRLKRMRWEADQAAKKPVAAVAHPTTPISPQLAVAASKTQDFLSAIDGLTLGPNSKPAAAELGIDSTVQTASCTPAITEQIIQKLKSSAHHLLAELQDSLDSLEAAKATSLRTQ